MNVWHKIKSWFSKKEVDNGWHKKIVAVRGEDPAGILRVDVGTFDSDGPVPIESQMVEWKIVPSARASVNRILAGIGTEEDSNVLELAIAALL